MMRSLLTLIASSAAYGFSIGISNSWVYGLRNLVKFPLLILTTAVVCALLYHVLARFFGVSLGFVMVQRLVLAIFRDTSRLLAALSPAICFLATSMPGPQDREPGEYRRFLMFNVVAIAICGCLAVYYRSRERLLANGSTQDRRPMLVASWMLASLLVGGQVCWYIRPFFGATAGTSERPWFTGTTPDHNGATSFYEAVFNILVPAYLR